MRRVASLFVGFVMLATLSPRPVSAGLLDCLGVTLHATPDTATTTAGVKLSVAAPGVLQNDVDLNLLGTATADQTSGATYGTATLNENGAYTYTPPAGFVGTDQFHYRVVCGLLASSPTTVTITVQPLAAPTPAPTPRPTPSPTPRPTPTPTPLLSLPPLPTLPLPTLPLPTLPPLPTIPPLSSPSPSPTLPPISLPPLASPSATPALPSPTVAPSPTSRAPVPVTTSPPGGPSASPAASSAPTGSTAGSGGTGGSSLGVPGSEPGAGISVGSLPIDLGTFAIWLVPGFALTVPGLLIVLIVAAQLAGGGLFVPIARRRLRGTGAEPSRTLAG